MDTPPLSLSTEHRDMWSADLDLRADRGPGRSISPDIGHVFDRDCPFLLRWPDRVHKSVEVSTRSYSRSPAVPDDGAPGLAPLAYSPAEQAEELYDTEPPPGFKVLKKVRDMRPTRQATTSTNSSRTSARQQSLGDGFSAEEAKPLKEKPENHSKKRKRCDPSPIIGTLQVVLLSQPDENARSQGKCGLGSVSRSIIEPLRPRPIEKEATAVGDVVWLEANEVDEADETNETNGTDEAGISVVCDADGEFAAESETTDEATLVNSGERRQGRGQDWDWDWGWDCSVTGLPSLR